MFDIPLALENVKRGAVLTYRATRGILCLAGVDAQNFIQRLSTNDLTQLSSKHGMQTSFTDNKGRMIDHCLAFALVPDSIILVSSHENSDALFSWLEQFQFIEEFVMTDVSAQFSLRYVITSASSLIKPDSLSLWCWDAHVGNDRLRFFATIGKRTFEDEIGIDEPTFQSLRIAALMPDCPGEINDRFMPQNINLDQFIADNKGCFIGQEVLAKAKTYQKQKKILCGVPLPPSAQPLIKPGSLIESKSGAIGEVTSVAPNFIASAVNALVITDLSTIGKGKISEVFKSQENFTTIANKSA